MTIESVGDQHRPMVPLQAVRKRPFLLYMKNRDWLILCAS